MCGSERQRLRAMSSSLSLMSTPIILRDCARGARISRRMPDSSALPHARLRQ